jgi:hypothetical protein
MKTKQEIFQAFLDAKIIGTKRRPVSRDDFGDDATIGLCVRKRKGLYQTLDMEAYVFGKYLGEVKGKWIIAAMRTLDLIPTDLIEYDSLIQLQNDWELD